MKMNGPGRSKIEKKKIIKVFFKILSLETILNAYTRTRTHGGIRTHNHTDYTKLNLHSLKWAANARETWNG